jgi:hypothetical protein
MMVRAREEVLGYVNRLADHIRCSVDVVHQSFPEGLNDVAFETAARLLEAVQTPQFLDIEQSQAFLRTQFSVESFQDLLKVFDLPPVEESVPQPRPDSSMDVSPPREQQLSPATPPAKRSKAFITRGSVQDPSQVAGPSRLPIPPPYVDRSSSGSRLRDEGVSTDLSLHHKSSDGLLKRKRKDAGKK